MKAFIIPNDLIGVMPHGFANGYVVVDKESPLHGMDYNFVDQHVMVHGDLTYGDTFQKLGLKDRALVLDDDQDISLDNWVFGFDTMHYGDNPRTMDLQKVIHETKMLLAQLVALEDNASLKDEYHEWFISENKY